MNAYDIVENVLKEKTKLGVNKRQALAEEVIDTLAVAGFLAEGLHTVSVVGARVPIEAVTVYGLEVSVDANGNAVSISSPYGLEVAEEEE